MDSFFPVLLSPPSQDLSPYIRRFSFPFAFRFFPSSAEWSSRCQKTPNVSQPPIRGNSGFVLESPWGFFFIFGSAYASSTWFLPPNSVSLTSPSVGFTALFCQRTLPEEPLLSFCSPHTALRSDLLWVNPIHPVLSGGSVFLSPTLFDSFSKIRRDAVLSTTLYFFNTCRYHIIPLLHLPRPPFPRFKIHFPPSSPFPPSLLRSRCTLPVWADWWPSISRF